MSDRASDLPAANPLPPLFIHLERGIHLAAGLLRVSKFEARLKVLDALCDDVIAAWGNAGDSQFLRISPENWMMVKYEGALLNYSYVGMFTDEILRWLYPPGALRPEPSVAPSAEVSKEPLFEVKPRGRPRKSDAFGDEAIRARLGEYPIETTLMNYVRDWITEEHQRNPSSLLPAPTTLANRVAPIADALGIPRKAPQKSPRK